MQWKKFNFPDERIFHYSRILEVTKMTEHPGPVSLYSTFGVCVVKFPTTNSGLYRLFPNVTHIKYHFDL